MKKWPLIAISISYCLFASFDVAASQCDTPVQYPSGDRKLLSMVRYFEKIASDFSNDDRAVPLELKARHYQELIEKFHLRRDGVFSPRVWLSTETTPFRFDCGADDATWNGVLLATWSYEYAVRPSEAVAERIRRLVKGMHLFFEVTQRYGLVARCVIESDEPVKKAIHQYRANNARNYFFRSNPAKGTYLQLLLGYSILFLHAEKALSEETRSIAYDDFSSLVLHLVGNDYRIVGRDGRVTRYGRVSPFRFGVIRIPFDAQLSYAFSAAGVFLEIQDQQIQERLFSEWSRLRNRHAYYAGPYWPPLFRPQMLSHSRLIGANDQNHLATAALLALLFEFEAISNGNRSASYEVLDQLSSTLRESFNVLSKRKHALTIFRWLGIKTYLESKDDFSFEASLEPQSLSIAVEQLRRFPLNRLRYQGTEKKSNEAQWVDAYRPDSYYWKVDPRMQWEKSDGVKPLLTAAVDYLHAYWVMRFYKLDQAENLKDSHGMVLGSCDQNPL